VCQKADKDPREVIVQRLDRIVELILAGAMEDSKVPFPASGFYLFKIDMSVDGPARRCI
jgi:hypothetical protein